MAAAPTLSQMNSVAAFSTHIHGSGKHINLMEKSVLVNESRKLEESDFDWYIGRISDWICEVCDWVNSKCPDIPTYLAFNVLTIIAAIISITEFSRYTELDVAVIEEFSRTAFYFDPLPIYIWCIVNHVVFGSVIAFTRYHFKSWNSKWGKKLILSCSLMNVLAISILLILTSISMITIQNLTTCISSDVARSMYNLSFTDAQLVPIASWLYRRNCQTWAFLLLNIAEMHFVVGIIKDLLVELFKVGKSYTNVNHDLNAANIRSSGLMGKDQSIQRSHGLMAATQEAPYL